MYLWYGGTLSWVCVVWQGRDDDELEANVSSTIEVKASTRDQIVGGIIDDVMSTTPPIRSHIVVCGPGTISVSVAGLPLRLTPKTHTRPRTCMSW